MTTLPISPNIPSDRQDLLLEILGHIHQCIHISNDRPVVADRCKAATIAIGYELMYDPDIKHKQYAERITMFWNTFEEAIKPSTLQGLNTEQITSIAERKLKELT